MQKMLLCLYNIYYVLVYLITKHPKAETGASSRAALVFGVRASSCHLR